MAAYEYTARDETGRIFKGLYEDAGGVNALRNEFAKIGYSLLKVKRSKKIQSKKFDCNASRSHIVHIQTRRYVQRRPLNRAES